MHFKPARDLVALETKLKEEKTTEHGIIYKGNNPSESDMMIWSTVYDVGPDVVGLKPGDEVLWKIGSNNGAYFKDGDLVLDIVQFSNILVAREKNESE